jgi:hypothetical protein
VTPFVLVEKGVFLFGERKRGARVYPILPATTAHRFLGEAVMAMADDVGLPGRLVDTCSTSAFRERMGRR